MSIFTKLRQRKAQRDLAASLKPDPDYKARRAAQLPTERKDHIDWLLAGGVRERKTFKGYPVEAAHG